MIRSFLKGGVFYKTPQLHENASISKDSDIVNKWYVDTKVNNTQIDTKQYVDSTKAPLASPALTGVPTAPTAAVGTNNTQIATTAFVQSALNSGSSAGSIGTTALMRHIAISGKLRGTYPLNYTQAPGAILAGSVLRFIDLNGVAHSQVPTGTWMCTGYSLMYMEEAGSYDYYLHGGSTTWTRIS